MNQENGIYAELFDRSREIENRIVADQASRTRHIEAGDLFILKMPIPVPVSWCAVFTHSNDDALWYCVPGDSFSLNADTDVTACALGLRSELNFRCHCGLWVHADDMNLSNRFARVDQSDVDLIRAKVAEIATSPTTVLNSDVSHDPDYAEWIDELRHAVDLLLHSLHDEPTVAVRLIGPESAINAYYEVHSLAADDSIDSSLEAETPALIETRQVSDSDNGRMQVSLYEDGIVMEWYPKTPDAPNPKVWHETTLLRWFPQQGFYCTSVIPWNRSEVELKLADEIISISKP